MAKRRKSLLTFYEEVFYTDKDSFKTNLGVLRLDRHHFLFYIGDFTQIYYKEMSRFPYPKLKSN